MARLVLVTACDPQALLSAAAAPFCVQGRVAEPLPLLVVRQGGLRDAVHQAAAAAGCSGWLGRPLIVFSELPSLLSGPSAPLDSFEREALLRRAIAETAASSLGSASAQRALTSALDRLFGDLIAEGVQPHQLGAALDTLDADAWELGRNRDLRTLYDRYLDLLAKLPPAGDIQRTDGRDDKRLAAEALRRDPERVAERLRRPLQPPGQRRSIDIYGLADLRRGWRPLLDALRATPIVDELRVHLPGHVEDSLAQWTREHAAETRVVGGTPSAEPALARLRASLFAIGHPAIPPSPDVQVTAAPDSTRELEQAARRIKRLLLDGDASGARPAPHEIAVVSRKARPYLTLAADVLASYGIPVHARLRHTLSEVPAVAALLRLLRVAGSGWSVGGLAELASSPYFNVELDLGLLRPLARSARPRGLAAWQQALEALRAQSPDAEDAEDVAERERHRAAAACAEWVSFATHASPLDERHSLAGWIDLTRSMMGQPSHGASGDSGIFDFAARATRELAPTAPALLRDALRLDTGALREVDELLVAWRDASRLDPASDRAMDAGQWAAELERALAEQEVTVRTGTPGGVQLLEALAAEGRSFTHLFMVGLSAGSFPAVSAGDPLLSDGERERLHASGLPVEPMRVWLDREQSLFRELMRAPTRSLHLSYAYADHAGAPQLPSAYLDDVISCFEREGTVTRIGGSELSPRTEEEIWSVREALRMGATSLRADGNEATAGRLLSIAAAEENGSAGSVAQLLHAARMERERVAARVLPEGTARNDAVHPWNGQVTDPALLEHLRATFGDRTWSATQLESYGRCPFSFFGKYVLRAHAPEEEDDDEVTGRDFGIVMHSALALTYQALRDQAPEDPLSLRNFDLARGILADAVRLAVEQHGGSYLAIAALRAARERETVLMLEEYLHWEMQRNDAAKFTRRPLHMELGFGIDGGGRPEVRLEHEGRTLRLRGQIDRVDEVIDAGGNYRYVVDHKAGGSAFAGITTLRPAGGVLQLGLYLLALEQLEPGVRLWGGAYQTVRSLEAKGALDRCSVTQQGIKERETPTQQKADAAIRDSARVALQLVDDILGGRFPARPPEKVDCLSYCDYRDVCREERLKSW